MKARAMFWVLLGAFVATDASAERLLRAVTDVTTTEDVRGNSQILFRWDPTIPEGTVAVRRALLRFEVDGRATSQALTLRIYPVTAPWDGNSPHVAYDAELWSHAELDLRRGGPVVMDLTTVVKEIVEQGLTNYGFVLQAEPSAEDGLTSSDLASLGGLSNAMMEVTWRKVPPKPARRGQE